MAEDTKETLKRLAKALRDEANDAKARHIEQYKEVRSARVTDADYQRGRIGGLTESARLLDEGEGG